MNTQRGISGWLVRHAAAWAPPSLRERLEEEWLADLQVRRNHVSRLLFGLGCCWAVQTIAREFPAGVTAASAGTGGLATAGVGFHPSQRWSQRPGAMTVIVAAHVVVIYTFANLFNTTPPAKAPPILQGTVMSTDPVKNPPPPILKVHLTETSVGQLPLNNHFAFPADPISISPPSGTPDIGGGIQQPKSVVVPGGPGAGFPTAEDYYPTPAKWLGEQGSAAVRVCVDPSGKLTQAPTIDRSAGSTRLDAGAIQLARAGSGHYRPARENGRALSSCFAFKVTFRLQ